MSSLTDKTTIVVGASRGLGRGVATALAQAGASVVAVARTGQATGEVAPRAGVIHDEIADAGAPTVAAGLLDRHNPDVIVLVAGATPYMRPLQQQTWDTFSVHWQTDVRIAFHWLRESSYYADIRIEVASRDPKLCRSVSAEKAEGHMNGVNSIRARAPRWAASVAASLGHRLASRSVSVDTPGSSKAANRRT